MDTTQLPWQKQRPNVMNKPLARDDDWGMQFDLMKLSPNVTYERHSHPKFEWVYVMQGSLVDERGTFKAGDFFVNDANFIHQPHTGPEGAELIIVWCGNVTSVQ